MATPLQTLKASGHIEYALVHLMPWNMGRLRQLLRGLDQWDVIWLSRPRHYFMLPVIREAQRLKKPVLIDIDDWLLDVPQEHVDADFYRTRARRETIRTALRAVDAVTVSTEIIAEYCRTLGVRAHVLPNAIDCDQFVRQPRDRDKEGSGLTLAFCGTPSHYDDVPLIVPALRELLRSRPAGVRVVSVGCPIPELHGMAGYTHHDFVPATEYAGVLSDLRIDIGLAPLQDTLFNRAKSDIKYLEYSATGAATIASPVAPYQAALREDRGIIVDANTTEAWSTAISHLIGQGERRQSLAANAYKWVRDERSIEATAGKWYEIFRTHVEGHTTGEAPGLRQLDAGRFERVMANIVVRQTPHDAQQLGHLLVQNMRSVRRRRWRHR